MNLSRTAKTMRKIRMKWTFKNYKGEFISWYSADVIEKIKKYCIKYSKSIDKNTTLSILKPHIKPILNDILNIIKEGEKNEV